MSYKVENLTDKTIPLPLYNGIMYQLKPQATWIPLRDEDVVYNLVVQKLQERGLLLVHEIDPEQPPTRKSA